MVLRRGSGMSLAQAAAAEDTSAPTVSRWVQRYERYGLVGLEDIPKPGRPAQVSARVRARIVALARTSPPERTGLSHWSSRELAKYLKRDENLVVSHNFVATLLRDNGIVLHRRGTFKLSKDPDFVAKVTDVVGLYLDPPASAVVLCVDEKTQIQALDRTAPLLPLSFGKTEKRTHDYVRHGTTNLFAAYEAGTGQVTGACFPRRRTKEFLAFMTQVAQRYQGRQLHVVLDNLSTHKGDEVDAWLTKHPNVTFHHTPIGSSWLNQVETWFGVITRQAILRGTFTSVRLLIKTIQNYIDHWNTDAQPFTWKATADDILAKVALTHTEVRKLLDNNPA